MVARDVTGRAVHDPARLVAEGVPDARALAVLGGRPLDLVRRSAGTEPEARWKQRVRHGDHCVGDRHGSSGIGPVRDPRVGTPDAALVLVRLVLRPRARLVRPAGRAQRRPARHAAGVRRARARRRRPGHLGGHRRAGPRATRPARRRCCPAGWRSPAPARGTTHSERAGDARHPLRPDVAAPRAARAASRSRETDDARPQRLRAGPRGRRGRAHPRRPGRDASRSPTWRPARPSTLPDAPLRLRLRRHRRPDPLEPGRAAGGGRRVRDRRRAGARRSPPRCRPSCWSGPSD